MPRIQLTQIEKEQLAWSALSYAKKLGIPLKKKKPKSHK
jgi:hypothetical protein